MEESAIICITKVEEVGTDATDPGGRTLLYLGTRWTCEGRDQETGHTALFTLPFAVRVGQSVKITAVEVPAK